jgi:hypothetical protein
LLFFLMCGILGLVRPPETLCARQRTESPCAACPSRGSAPSYRIASRTRTDTGGYLVRVSIDSKKFTPHDLVFLACRFDSDFEKENDVVVLIFDSYQSARRYVAPYSQEKPPTWQKDETSQRATYVRQTAKGVHSIELYRDPLTKKDFQTIDFCPSAASATR